ncbi:ATP-binding protein, partial [Photobacterium damselae]
MLLIFATENFKGIRTKQVLDLTSNQGDEFSDTIHNYNGISANICSCLVGANGSGKTHALKAIHRFASAINKIESIKESHDPYILDNESQSHPTTYEALLYNKLNDHLYEYSFSSINGNVLTEKLYIKENKKGSRLKLVFNRDEDNITFGKNFATKGNLLKTMITPKGLLTYYAQGLDIEHINFINEWAKTVYFFNPNSVNFIGEKLIENFEDRINNVDKSSDLSNDDLLIDILNTVSQELKKLGLPIEKVCFEKNDQGKYFYNIKHKTQGDEERSFNLEKAKDFFSDGTFNAINLTLFIITCSFNGALILLDEYDISLHHSLSIAILRLIRQLNKKNNVQTIIS